jgi:hypothetical protein
MDKPGIGVHTDYELFTLLRSTAPGLEVMNESGVWIDAPPRPDAYVVNIGDMLELWTGGEFVATSHRVRKVSQERYSFPLFFTVDYHTRIAPMPRPRAADPAAHGRPGARRAGRAWQPDCRRAPVRADRAHLPLSAGATFAGRTVAAGRRRSTGQFRPAGEAARICLKNAEKLIKTIIYELRPRDTQTLVVSLGRLPGARSARAVEPDDADLIQL